MRGVVSKMSLVSMLAGVLILGQDAVAGTCDDVERQLKQAQVDLTCPLFMYQSL